MRIQLPILLLGHFLSWENIHQSYLGLQLPVRWWGQWACRALRHHLASQVEKGSKDLPESHCSMLGEKNGEASFNLRAGIWQTLAYISPWPLMFAENLVGRWKWRWSRSGCPSMSQTPVLPGFSIFMNEAREAVVSGGTGDPMSHLEEQPLPSSHIWLLYRWPDLLISQQKPDTAV